MKINEKVQHAINEQINAEFFSAYQYLAMAAYFEEQSLKGFAHWMRLQSNEEVAHALKLYDYLIDRGGTVALQSIPAPKKTWQSPVEVVEDAHQNELKVTELINNLANVAQDEKDHATNVFLHWFVTEQVEEEDNSRELVDQVKLAGKTGEGLFILDRELSKRTPQK